MADCPLSGQFTITKDIQGERLDKVAATLLSGHSRSAISRYITQQAILLNNKPVKAAATVKEGDLLTWALPTPIAAKATAEEMELAILYEDAHIIVINKPSGLVVHPGAGIDSGTLVNGLLAHCNDLSGVGGELRPGIIHRLDKGTSGVLIVAKNDAAHINLSAQFAARTTR